MAIQGADVIGGSQAQALVGLGHQVADIDLYRRGIDHGLGDAGNQEIGDEAGEKRTRADGDQVGASHGLQGLGQGLDIRRIQKKLLDAAATGGDFGFAANPAAILHQSFELDVGGGGGINVSAGKQNFRGQADGFAEVAGDGGQGGEK